MAQLTSGQTVWKIIGLAEVSDTCQFASAQEPDQHSRALDHSINYQIPYVVHHGAMLLLHASAGTQSRVVASI